MSVKLITGRIKKRFGVQGPPHEVNKIESFKFIGFVGEPYLIFDTVNICKVEYTAVVEINGIKTQIEHDALHFTRNRKPLDFKTRTYFFRDDPATKVVATEDSRGMNLSYDCILYIENHMLGQVDKANPDIGYFYGIGDPRNRLDKAR